MRLARALVALALLLAASGLACVVWPLAWVMLRLRLWADRLQRRGAGQASMPDAVAWAVISRHERDMAAGRARWQ